MSSQYKFADRRIAPLARSREALALVVLLIALVVATAPLSAQKQKDPLPDANRRALILQEAASLTNIWSAHGTPFHLRARVSSINGLNERKGQFEIWWSSPSKFKDQITWGNQTTTHIANGDKLWTDGDDLHRRDTYRVLRLLAFSARLETVDTKTPRAFRKTIDGQSTACIETKLMLPVPDGSGLMVPTTIKVGNATFVSVSTACVNESTNLPLEINDAGYRFALSDYVAIGTAWFPRNLRQYTLKDEIVSIQADVLEKLSVDYSDFTPRDGLTADPWCANPVPPAPLAKFVTDIYSQPVTPGAHLTPFPVHDSMLVFRVDNQGRATSLRAFDAGGEATLHAKERARLFATPFTPASCNGTPIAAEYIFYGFPLAR